MTHPGFWPAVSGTCYWKTWRSGNIPLSHKKLRRALKAITRSESYLCAMKAGACRYDTEGYVTEHISQEEEVYAAEASG
uniref:IncF plasmid conjugative transfer fertility inhibition protein FinO n=1 Tax=Escherichia coli TaxID=562 RepID=A0A3Q8VKV6_ECOLX|nr:IncF plasmid conjugative transfer fertility inhibition protein FinO [Escherichia coli]